MRRAGGIGGRGGFSLPELLTVLLIGSLAMAMTVPAMTKMVRRAKLEEGSGRMEQVLKLARQKALSRRTHFLVTLNPGEGSYRVAYADTGGSWIPDRDSLYVMPQGIAFQGQINGSGFSSTSGSNVQILLEPRGTLAQRDAPMNLQFFNDRGDTVEIEMVRTGRVRSWHR